LIDAQKPTIPFAESREKGLQKKGIDELSLASGGRNDFKGPLTVQKNRREREISQKKRKEEGRIKLPGSQRARGGKNGRGKG